MVAAVKWLAKWTFLISSFPGTQAHLCSQMGKLRDKTIKIEATDDAADRWSSADRSSLKLFLGPQSFFTLNWAALLCNTRRGEGDACEQEECQLIDWCKLQLTETHCTTTLTTATDRDLWASWPRCSFSLVF